jgi:hypothetical protein
MSIIYVYVCLHIYIYTVSAHRDAYAFVQTTTNLPGLANDLYPVEGCSDKEVCCVWLPPCTNAAIRHMLVYLVRKRTRKNVLLKHASECLL